MTATIEIQGHRLVATRFGEIVRIDQRAWRRMARSDHLHGYESRSSG